MRNFDYTKYKNALWPSEILSLVALIHEFKGKQELYRVKKPVTLEKLVETAKIQSTESSNAIEGIHTTNARLKQLCSEKTAPKNCAEEEIAGYRYVLNEIHENFTHIPVTPNYILQLHRDLYRYSAKDIGGKYKTGQNQIVAEDADGKRFVLFTPPDALETPDALKNACGAYASAAAPKDVDALLLIPIFIHDFLCIHPFDDGNGRMSRLLTTLLLYREGYTVGRYISLESKINATKSSYYDALKQSEEGWYDGNENAAPFIVYLLGTIVAAYRDLDERISAAELKTDAVQYVRQAAETKYGKFTKSDIMDLCPAIGRATTENSLTRLVKDGVLDRYGSGRATYYIRHDGTL